jgi:hypothetical protein
MVTVRRILDTTAVRWVLAVGALMLVSSVMLLAQDSSGGTGSPSTVPQLTSVGAVVVASITCTALLKRALVNVPLAQAVPVWVYVVVLAIGFTYLANKILGTLPGDFWLLAWEAVYNGAAASGIREWVYTGLGKPLTASVASAHT